MAKLSKTAVLRKAKEKQNDEYYTRLEDIEMEISQHKDYVKQFYGKTVLCNCDDPEWSNFFVFFRNHFNQLKLKKLITTHYEKPEEVKKIVKEIDENGNEIEKEITEVIEKPSYKIEWCGEMLNDDPINMITTPLKGNGDFRSEECIEILKEADIVVTNPPFSLFREYVAQIIEYNKKFVILGNTGAVAYKEFFPLIRTNKVWIGYKSPSGGMWFTVPEAFAQKVKIGEEKATWKEENGILLCNCPAMWYTNLEIDKIHEPLILTKNYKGNEEKYIHYENYPDAINVNSVKDIPKDYFGKMGVPITYMAEHCPDQFEIIGLGNGYLGQSIGISSIPKEHKQMMKGHSAAGDLYMMVDGKPKVPYGRIIIKRKENKD